MNEFEKLIKLLGDAGVDAYKFYEKGNKTAGVRLRKAMLELVKAAGAVRKEVVEKRA